MGLGRVQDFELLKFLGKGSFGAPHTHTTPAPLRRCLPGAPCRGQEDLRHQEGIDCCVETTVAHRPRLSGGSC